LVTTRDAAVVAALPELVLAVWPGSALVVDAPGSAATEVGGADDVTDGIVTSVVVDDELVDDPPSEHAASPTAAAARRTSERLEPTMARQ
jgi:hypothetical protein